MAVTIATKFYANNSWHDMAKIVFTSPYIENPSVKGTRSHILPGRLDLGMWYEDETYMYRISDKQIEDTIVYFDNIGNFKILNDVDLGAIDNTYISVSGITTISGGLYKEYKDIYNTPITYLEVDTVTLNNITVSGTDADNVDDLFLTGNIYNYDTITNVEVIDKIIPVYYRTGFCDIKPEAYFRNEVLFIEDVNVNMDKIVETNITKSNGWIGRKLSDDGYIEFEFISPERITKLSFDSVIQEYSERTTYDINSVDNASWAGSSKTIEYDDITIGIDYSDSWIEQDDKLINNINSETIDGCDGVSSYNYGINLSSTTDVEDFYNEFKVSHIAIKASNDKITWVQLYDNTFNGEAIFNHDTKYKYYRLYLVNALNINCPQCMLSKKYNPVQPDMVTLSGSDNNYDNVIDVLFGNNNISDNNTYYMSSSGTHNNTVYYNIGTIDDTHTNLSSVDHFKYNTVFSEDIEFNYDKQIESKEVISDGIYFNKIDDNIYIDFNMVKPKRIVGLSMGEVVHNINRKIILNNTSTNDPSWDSKNESIAIDTEILNIEFNNDWGIDENLWKNSGTIINSTKDTNNYILCYGINSSKTIELSDENNIYNVSRIKFQIYDETTDTYVDIYNGFIEDEVYFDHDLYSTKYRLHLLESSTINDRKEVLESIDTNISSIELSNFFQIMIDRQISGSLYDVMIGNGFATSLHFNTVDLPKNINIEEAYINIRAKYDSNCESNIRAYVVNDIIDTYDLSILNTLFNSVVLPSWTSLEWYKIDITDLLKDMVSNNLLSDTTNNRISEFSVILKGESDVLVEGQPYYRGYGISSSYEPNVYIKWNVTEKQVDFKQKSPAYYNTTISGNEGVGFNSIHSANYITHSGINDISIYGSELIDILYRVEYKDIGKSRGFDINNFYYESIKFNYDKSINDRSLLHEGWVCKDNGEQSYIDFDFTTPTRIVGMSFDNVIYNYKSSIKSSYTEPTFSGGQYSGIDGCVVTYSNDITNIDGEWSAAINKVEYDDTDGYGICYGLKDSIDGFDNTFSEIYGVSNIRIEAQYDNSDAFVLLYEGTFDGEIIFKHVNLYKKYRLFIIGNDNVDTTLKIIPPAKYGISIYNTADSIYDTNKLFVSGIYENVTNEVTLSGSEQVDMNYSVEYIDDINSSDYKYKKNFIINPKFKYIKYIEESYTLDKGWVGKKENESDIFLMLEFDTPTNISAIEFDSVDYTHYRKIITDYTDIDSMPTNYLYKDIYNQLDLEIIHNGSWNNYGNDWIYSNNDIVTLSGELFDPFLISNYSVADKSIDIENVTDKYGVGHIKIYGKQNIEDDDTFIYSSVVNNKLTFDNANSYKYYKIVLKNDTHPYDEVVELSKTSYTLLDGSGVYNNINSIYHTDMLVSGELNTTTLSGSHDIDIWCNTEYLFSNADNIYGDNNYLYKNNVPFEYIKNINEDITIGGGYRSDNKFSFLMVFDIPTNITAISFDPVEYKNNREIQHTQVGPNYNIDNKVYSINGIDVEFNKDWEQNGNGWVCTIKDNGSVANTCYGFIETNSVYKNNVEKMYWATEISVLGTIDNITYDILYNGKFDGFKNINNTAKYSTYKIILEKPHLSDSSTYTESPIFNEEENIIYVSENETVTNSICNYIGISYKDITTYDFYLNPNNGYMGRYNGNFSDLLLIFDNVNIDNSIKVVDAYIEFTAVDDITTNYQIPAILSLYVCNRPNIILDDLNEELKYDNSLKYNYNFKSQIKNYVSFDIINSNDVIGGDRWTIDNWEDGIVYRTPNISKHIQSIINKEYKPGSIDTPSIPGWDNNNSIAIFIMEDKSYYDSVRRFDCSTYKPKLVIVYDDGVIYNNDIDIKPQVKNPSNYRYIDLDIENKCNVKSYGITEHGIDGIFDDGYICESFNNMVTVTGNISELPIPFYVNYGFDDVKGTYRFTDTYDIYVPFEYDKEILNTETKKAGWAGKKVSDTAYIDFEFDFPVRIVRLDMDDVVHNGSRKTKNIYNNYVTTWSGTTKEFLDSNAYGDIALSLHHTGELGTFKMINDEYVTYSGTDSVWRTDVTNVTDYFSSYDSSNLYDDWEYSCVGLNTTEDMEESYYSRMKLKSIRIEAGNSTEDMDILYETGVTDNTIFDGKALFLHNNEYKYYRLYLLDHSTAVSNEYSYKLIPNSNINYIDLSTDSSNISTIGMNDTLYNNSYNTIPSSGIDNLTLTNRLMSCYNTVDDEYENICTYEVSVPFKYNVNRTSVDNKDMGWVADSDGSFVIELNNPMTLNRITFDAVEYNISITDTKDYYEPIWNPSDVSIKGDECWYDNTSPSYLTVNKLDGSALGSTVVNLLSHKSINSNGSIVLRNMSDSDYSNLFGWNIVQSDGYDDISILTQDDSSIKLSLDSKLNNDIDILLSSPMTIINNSTYYLNNTVEISKANIGLELINKSYITTSGIDISFLYDYSDGWAIDDYSGSINPFIVDSDNSQISLSINGDSINDCIVTFYSPIAYNPTKIFNLLYVKNCIFPSTYTMAKTSGITMPAIMSVEYNNGWFIRDNGGYTNSKIVYNTNRRVDVSLNGSSIDDVFSINFSSTISYSGQIAPDVYVTNISDQTLINSNSYAVINNNALTKDAIVKLTYKGYEFKANAFGDKSRQYIGWEVVSYNGDYSGALVVGNSPNYASICMNTSFTQIDMSLNTIDDAKVSYTSNIVISNVSNNGDIVDSDILWNVSEHGDIGFEGIEGTGELYLKYNVTGIGSDRITYWTMETPEGKSNTGVFADIEDPARPFVITSGNDLGFSFDDDVYVSDLKFNSSKECANGSYIKIVMTYSTEVVYPEVTLNLVTAVVATPKVYVNIEYIEPAEPYFTLNFDYVKPILPEINIDIVHNISSYPLITLSGVEYSDVFEKWYSTVEDDSLITNGCSEYCDATVYEHTSYGVSRYLENINSKTYEYTVDKLIIDGSNTKDGEYVTVFSGELNAPYDVIIDNSLKYSFYKFSVFNSEGKVGMKNLKLYQNAGEAQYYKLGISNLKMYDYIDDNIISYDGFGVSNFKAYRNKYINDYDIGISNFKIYSINNNQMYDYGIRNLKLLEYAFEGKADYGIRDLKLLEYECEDDYKFGISNLKMYDYSDSDYDGTSVSNYIIANNGKVEKLITNNIANINGNYSLKVVDSIPMHGGGDYIRMGDGFYIYKDISDITGNNSVLFEVENGECYNCRLTAWDDATHSTLLNPIFLGDHCKVSAFCFYLNDGSNATLLNNLTEENIRPIMAPVVNRIFKGGNKDEDVNLYYGDFDLIDRQENNQSGDYILFKPGLYNIDESMPYGIHDFLIVLHYSYT